MTVAGKTGTAQVVSLDSQSDQKKHRDHAWFTSYAPAEDPEIAVTVLIEHGGKGGSVAAPIARKILEVYKTLKEEREADDNV
jgi:penicillin-binding protein 2